MALKDRGEVVITVVITPSSQWLPAAVLHEWAFAFLLDDSI